MVEQEALIILNAVPELGAVRIRKLVGCFGSALEVLGASLDELSESSVVPTKIAQNIFHFSRDKFIQDEYNLIQRLGLEVITSADAKFPCSFKDDAQAPVVLYVKGEAGCLKQNSVAMVGSRAASFYGCRSAKAFARAFVESGLLVVSGLARGIDTAAHQGCLEAGGRTVAVVGCGFNHIYPKENLPLMDKIAQNGAVVSEFACSMPPLKQNFPWRNRIISALSLATVVIEAGKRSGALITADFALAQHKDVFVLPSNIDNETGLGSNLLIQEGAKVALKPEDVLSQLKAACLPSQRQNLQPLPVLNDEQSKVFSLITHEPVFLDELSRQSGFHISSLMNIILSLELKHAVRQLPGHYYVRNEHA